MAGPQPGLLSRLADEAVGAFSRYGRRSAVQRDASLQLLEQSAAPGNDPFVGMGQKALGTIGLLTHPLAVFPTGDEWRERVSNAGGGRVQQAVGGMLGDLPSIIDPQMAAGGGLLAMAAVGGKAARKTAGKAAERMVFPEIADRYPTLGKPVLETDKKTGKQFLSKGWTPEMDAVEKARKAHMEDMSTNGYKPFFDPAARYDVNPAPYGDRFDTSQVVMKKPDTRAKYDAMARDPAASSRLDEAYDRGMKQADAAGNWYHMGQLEEEFIKELGPELGRKMFKERFADSMAATTGGADPTSNLLMSAYGNYLKQTGKAMPEGAYDMPYPIGGRYASGNMEQFKKMLMDGAGVTEANPKRYNFSGDFIGSKAPTIDEQMMGLFDPKLAVPAPGTYGHYQSALSDLAAKRGVDPRYYQEVAWAGAKDAKTKGGYKARPMISHVNDMIERTARLTGQTPQQALKRFIRADGPMYGMAPLGLLSMGDRQEDRR